MKGTASRGREPPLRGAHEANIPTEQSTTEADARLPRAHGQPRRSAGAEAAAGQGAQAIDGQHTTETAVLIEERVDQRLPRSRRIRKRAEFVRLQRSPGRRAGSGFVVITRLTRGRASRLGITASRKVGGAVVRNRIKRLVREFFRKHRHRIAPALDVLVIVRPEAATVSYADVERDLARALKLTEQR
jgi:ribonuclease P protein component